MTQVVKFDGAPGAGKTTALFETVDDLAAEGYALDDVLYLTFTRSGRREVRDRLADVYPRSTVDDRKASARTFHGAALVACLRAGVVEDVGAQVITQDDDTDVYRRFARSHGLRYEAPSGRVSLARAQDGGTVDGASGNRLFAVSEWLTLRRQPPEAHARAPVTLPFGGETAVSLLDAWEEYKRAGGGRDDVGADDEDDGAPLPLFEHHDYVEAAVEHGLVPDARVLFVDEFQDLSPLEYELFRVWRESGTFDHVYIAGDANQAVYGFRGATPWFFVNTPVDATRPLKQSYRVPSSPARVARGVLDVHPQTDPSGFRSERSGGTARHIPHPSDDDLVDLVDHALDTHTPDGGVVVFLLARTNRHVSALKALLRRDGVPHVEIGSRSQVWTETLAGTYRALRALDDGRPVLIDDVRALAEAVEDGDARADEIAGGRSSLQHYAPDDGEALAYEDVRRGFPEDVETLARSHMGFAEYRREALVSALSRGADHPPDHVRIGTIHASKGLEAPACILLGDYSKRVEDAYYADPSTAAEEHRLYYVGASRPSESLYVVTDYFDGPTFPAFEHGVPTSEVEDVEETAGGREVDV